MALSPARWASQPSAICERPALCTHKNSTDGTFPAAVPSAWARASSRWRAYRSAAMHSQL